MTTAMENETDRLAFTPVAVLIPEAAEWSDSDGDHVDHTQCTLLHLDSNDNTGPLYTREQWESGADWKSNPDGWLYRHGARGETDNLPEGTRVELLPDMVIFKRAVRAYYTDQWILDRTTQIYEVWAIDRRQHHHLCSFTPCYEASYLGEQWDEVDDLPENEHEDLWERIITGSAPDEEYKYFDVADIDSILKNKCRQGWNPANGKSGGYAIDVDSVTTADAYLALRESYQQSEF